jgi:hypothetical protein
VIYCIIYITVLYISIAQLLVFVALSLSFSDFH